MFELMGKKFAKDNKNEKLTALLLLLVGQLLMRIFKEFFEVSFHIKKKIFLINNIYFLYWFDEVSIVTVINRNNTNI